MVGVAVRQFAVLAWTKLVLCLLTVALARDELSSIAQSQTIRSFWTLIVQYFSLTIAGVKTPEQYEANTE